MADNATNVAPSEQDTSKPLPIRAELGPASYILSFPVEIRAHFDPNHTDWVDYRRSFSILDTRERVTRCYDLPE